MTGTAQRITSSFNRVFYVLSSLFLELHSVCLSSSFNSCPQVTLCGFFVSTCLINCVRHHISRFLSGIYSTATSHGAARVSRRNSQKAPRDAPFARCTLSRKCAKQHRFTQKDAGVAQTIADFGLCAFGTWVAFSGFSEICTPFVHHVYLMHHN